MMPTVTARVLSADEPEPPDASVIVGWVHPNALGATVWEHSGSAWYSSGDDWSGRGSSWPSVLAMLRYDLPGIPVFVLSPGLVA